MTLRGGSPVTAVMPVVTYSDNTKKILVNSQDSTWSESATEEAGKLWMSVPAQDSCQTLESLVTSGDFDSSQAEEALNMDGSSTYPLTVANYALLSCDVGDSPDAQIRLSFDGGYINAGIDLDSGDIYFEYENLNA